MTFRLASPSHSTEVEQISVSSFQAFSFHQASQPLTSPILPESPHLLGKSLAQADWFMKQECHRVLSEIKTFIGQINANTNSYIVLSFESHSRQWHVASLYQDPKMGVAMTPLTDEQQQCLQDYLLANTLLAHDVAWLQSGFEQLAESVELLSFAEHYEQNRDEARKHYRDIIADNLQLKTEIVFFNDQLLWTINGPRCSYYID